LKIFITKIKYIIQANDSGTTETDDIFRCRVLNKKKTKYLKQHMH